MSLLLTGLSLGQNLGYQYEIHQYKAQTIELDSTDIDTVTFMWTDYATWEWGHSAGAVTVWDYIGTAGTETDSVRIWYKPVDKDGNAPSNVLIWIKENYVESEYKYGERYMWRIYPDPCMGINIYFQQVSNDSTNDDATSHTIYIIEQ